MGTLTTSCAGRATGERGGEPRKSVCFLDSLFWFACFSYCGICKSSCCRLPVPKPASAAIAAQLLLILRPPPTVNQRVSNAITAATASKHLTLLKHWRNHTHASFLNHAARISRTIEDIKSYLSTRAVLGPAEVSQKSCCAKGLLLVKLCPWACELWPQAGHTNRSWRFL